MTCYGQETYDLTQTLEEQLLHSFLDPQISPLLLYYEMQFRPHPARRLSANLYDIYHCCVYSEKLLMTDRGTVRNM